MEEWYCTVKRVKPERRNDIRETPRPFSEEKRLFEANLVIVVAYQLLSAHRVFHKRPTPEQYESNNYCIKSQYAVKVP